MKKSLSELAYEIMKKKLPTYEKGSFLSVRKCARENGMSYTPMREAFQRLEREGLLKNVPNVGYFVTSMDVRDIVGIFQVRECLEPFVVGEIVSSISDREIKILEEINDLQRECIEKGDICKYVLKDEIIHSKAFEFYGNEYLIDIYKNLREKYRICSNEIAQTLNYESIDEHEKIIEALKSRSKDIAISACREHILKAKQRVINGYISVN